MEREFQEFYEFYTFEELKKGSSYIFKCNFSNLTFKSKNILQKHVQLSHVKNPHAIENKFKCNFCDIICSEENILMKHIKRSIRVDETNAS